MSKVGMAAETFDAGSMPRLCFRLSSTFSKELRGGKYRCDLHRGRLGCGKNVPSKLAAGHHLAPEKGAT